MKLKDKITIVTGASSGMGKEIARLYLAEGAVVYGIDLNKERLDVATKEFSNADFQPLVADISHVEVVENILEQIIKSAGRIDVLVNNAGIMDDMLPVGEVSDQLWNKVLAVNLNGPMYLTRKAVKQMLEQGGGNIINIASIGGLYGSRAGAAYTVSKHGLIGLTKNTAFMYALKGIRCNAICPGAVATNIGETMRSPSQFGLERAMSGMVTNPKTGEAVDIASIALFLASEDSKMINGATLVADFGWTAY